VATGVGAFPPRQPELSNELLLLVSEFAAGACFTAGALVAGVEVPPEDGCPLLAGVPAGGVVAGCVVIAGVTVLEVVGATELGTPADTALTATAVVAGAPELLVFGGALTRTMSRMSIGGAPLSASGIETPADAEGTLGGSPSPEASLGRSARPMTKQQAKTATQRNTTSSRVRRWRSIRRLGISTGGLVTRIVFMRRGRPAA
jgi:hypothetical protein